MLVQLFNCAKHLLECHSCPPHTSWGVSRTDLSSCTHGKVNRLRHTSKLQAICLKLHQRRNWVKMEWAWDLDLSSPPPCSNLDSKEGRELTSWVSGYGLTDVWLPAFPPPAPPDATWQSHVHSSLRSYDSPYYTGADSHFRTCKVRTWKPGEALLPHEALN